MKSCFFLNRTSFCYIGLYSLLLAVEIILKSALYKTRTKTLGNEAKTAAGSTTYHHQVVVLRTIWYKSFFKSIFRVLKVILFIENSAGVLTASVGGQHWSCLLTRTWPQEAREELGGVKQLARQQVRQVRMRRTAGHGADSGLHHHKKDKKKGGWRLVHLIGSHLWWAWTSMLLLISVSSSPHLHRYARARTHTHRSRHIILKD